MNLVHQQWLLELTSIPTASGREARVVAWVRKWVEQHESLMLEIDAHGNLTIRNRAATPGRPAPIYFEAHMDHPAFVVLEQSTPLTLTAAFRGGVNQSYFAGSRIQLHHETGVPTPGVVVSIDDRPAKESWGANDGSKRLLIQLDWPATANPGDVLTWELPVSAVHGTRLLAPACDNLAGVAGALSALSTLLSTPGAPNRDIRILLTRAEEIGFIGAIAACKSETVPKNARIVVLENSKSYAESPIGGGPIVRVGDYASTFDPELTYKIGRIAQSIAATDTTFKFQRKLMPGGTCEASAFAAYGYTSTCVCLPLGNYHNMNESTSRIDSETIDVTDFHGLVRLLVAVGESLDDAAKSPGLKERLEKLYAESKNVLAE